MSDQCLMKRQEHSLRSLISPTAENKDGGADLPSQRFKRNQDIQRGAFSKSRRLEDNCTSDGDSFEGAEAHQKAQRKPLVSRVSPSKALRNR